jgi:hypothetical protein
MKFFYDRYWGILALTNPQSWNNINIITDGIRGFGYSGNASKLNDIHSQNLEGVGPIPAGLYTISKIYDDDKRGKHTCVLVPDSANKMYGRSGFLLHGDTAAEAHAASDGCIIFPYFIRVIFNVGDVFEVL